MFRTLAVICLVALIAVSAVLADGGEVVPLTKYHAQATFSASVADSVSGYGDPVDLGESNPYSSVVFLITVGTFPDSAHSGRYTFAFQDSAIGGTWSAVSASKLVGPCPVLVDSADGDQVYEIEYRRIKRFIRPKWTVAGGPTKQNLAPFNVIGLKMNPKYGGIH